MTPLEDIVGENRYKPPAQGSAGDEVAAAPIEFRSDNAAGAAPEMIDAIVRSNVGSALAYGGDGWTAALTARVRNVFEHPTAEVFPVISGTAANALGLAALCPPWGSVLCHETAHILRSECGATSMFGAGAVMKGLPGPDFKLTPAALSASFLATNWGDPHHSQPSVVSFTCPTDYGTLYSVEEVAAVAAVAKERGLKVHLDGARIANAIAALGCTPAALTWQAGVDVISLGAMKNGAVSTDAIVSFDSNASEQLVYRVKRAGHVASKMRFQSAQLDAYLTDGLWLRLAGHANAMMRRLADGLGAVGVDVVSDPPCNMAFAHVNREVSARMAAAGLVFYAISDFVEGRPDDRLIRFVTSFQTTANEIDEALSRIDRSRSSST
jgi:threonine aldolase